MNGRVKVGITRSDLETIGNRTNNIPVVKTSRRDFAYVLGKGLNGGTTVSGTIIVANLIGIDVFATGGIGGVHRDVENTMDVSADLIELGRTAITVVSSGIKSILDIPRTLEYLETHGVTVATYQSPEKDFPAFYSKKSGCKAPYNIESPVEAAKLIDAAKHMTLNSGILIAVPIPEEFSMDGKSIINNNLKANLHFDIFLNVENEINTAIAKALEEAKVLRIKGKQVTPFLLSSIGRITNNKSLESSKINDFRLFSKKLTKINKLY